MHKYKAKNEKVKRKYFRWLKEAEGYSPRTLDAIEKAIWKYEDFTKEDIQILSRINAMDIKVLNLDRHQTKLLSEPSKATYPNLAYVKELCASIKIDNDLDRRDQALIAFHFLSGMRVTAIYTLPIKCFDAKTLEVYQAPKFGVKTKFSKHIVTTLFDFDNELVNLILRWVEYIIKEHGFTNESPLFPRIKLELAAKDHFKYQGTVVEPVFLKSTLAITRMFKKRSQDAGLKHYSPHKFRHGTIAESRKFCKTEEQRKAVSQNLGHEHVGTTFSYGNMDVPQVNQIISKMSFQSSGTRIDELKNYSDDELLDELKSRR